METVLATILILDVYIVIYYRLMVKHLYEKEYKVKETAFVAIFSLPPYSRLSAIGKKYSIRYWFAVATMLLCVIILVITRDPGSFANLGEVTVKH